MVSFLRNLLGMDHREIASKKDTGSNAFAQEINDSERRRKEALQATHLFLGIWLAFGVSALALHALSLCKDAPSTTGTSHIGLNLFAISAFLAAASASAGGLVGFLFGIPRTMAPRSKQERESIVSPTTIPNQSTASDIPTQSVNTNLEDISDWLTKIIVGVGLVESQRILQFLKLIAERFKGTMGGSEIVVLGVIINFSAWGFFAGYLVTRLFLTSAFADILTWETLRRKLLDAIQQNTKLTTEKKILEQTAEAFTESVQGNYGEADTLFKKAITNSADSTPDGFKEILLQGSIFNSLYKPAPEGYEQAIAEANKYLATTPPHPSPIILVYQSFAYGQKYQYESQVLKKPEMELRPIRDASFRAIKQAIDLAPKLKDLARSVWDPPANSEDRDLECFKDFREFIELLGNDTSSANSRQPGDTR